MLVNTYGLTCLKGTTSSPSYFFEERHLPLTIAPDTSRTLVKGYKRQKTSSMSDPILPHDNDVLMGRGGKNNQHVGNEKLRELAREECEHYRRSSKKGKSYISRELVMKVRALNPPGRFLKRNQLTAQWEDVGDEIAREKTSQVLRDAVTNQMGGSPEKGSSSPGEGMTRSLSERIAPHSSFTSRERSRSIDAAEYQERPRSASTPISIGRGGTSGIAGMITQPDPQRFRSGYEGSEFDSFYTPSAHLALPDLQKPAFPPVTPISTVSHRKRRRHLTNPQSLSFDRYVNSPAASPDVNNSSTTASQNANSYHSENLSSYQHRPYAQPYDYHPPNDPQRFSHQSRGYFYHQNPLAQHGHSGAAVAPAHLSQQSSFAQQVNPNPIHQIHHTGDAVSPHHRFQSPSTPEQSHYVGVVAPTHQQHQPSPSTHQDRHISMAANLNLYPLPTTSGQPMHDEYRLRHLHYHHHYYNRQQASPQQQSSHHYQPPSPHQHPHPLHRQHQGSPPEAIPSASTHSTSSHGLLGDMQENTEDFDLFNGDLLEDTTDRDEMEHDGAPYPI